VGEVMGNDANIIKKDKFLSRQAVFPQKAVIFAMGSKPI
jgi:hypothetical protein